MKILLVIITFFIVGCGNADIQQSGASADDTGGFFHCKGEIDTNPYSKPLPYTYSVSYLKAGGDLTIYAGIDRANSNVYLVPTHPWYEKTKIYVKSFHVASGEPYENLFGFERKGNQVEIVWRDGGDRGVYTSGHGECNEGI